MITGIVVGNIHSTINHGFYDNKRLLIVDKTNADGTRTENYIIAVDSVGAGAGETVLVIDEGNSARQICRSPDAPVRSVIAGIIDRIDIG